MRDSASGMAKSPQDSPGTSAINYTLPESYIETLVRCTSLSRSTRDASTEPCPWPCPAAETNRPPDIPVDPGGCSPE